MDDQFLTAVSAACHFSWDVLRDARRSDLGDHLAEFAARTAFDALPSDDDSVAGGSRNRVTSARAELPDVEEMGPGVDLAVALDGADLARLGAYEVVEAAAGWQRLASWVAARQAATLAELTRRPELRPGECGYRSVNPVTNTALEVAARTTTTARQAENLVGHAVQLVEDFPATRRALEAGVIDERRAKVITSELGGHDAEVRALVERAVLPIAADLDSVALRQRVQYLLNKLAPVEAEERCQQARDGRYVAVTPLPDGMAHLEAVLPAEDAAAVKATLDAAAEADKHRDAEAGREPRTSDQRRADALAAFAWTALSTSHLGGHPGVAHRPDCACTCSTGTGDGDGDGSPFGSPHPLASAQGRPVTVHVTFPFTSLIGLDDEPGHLDGFGPIPAYIARHLAAAGIWKWVGTHPATGQVLDYGLTTYRPTQAIIDYVIMRDRTCRSPGCHRPAIRCQIDHRVPYSAGGPTSVCNCQPLCRTHHLLKHHGGWELDRLPSGATVWVSPTGHRYLKPPEQVGPITHPPDPPEREAGEHVPPF